MLNELNCLICNQRWLFTFDCWDEVMEEHRQTCTGGVICQCEEPVMYGYDGNPNNQSGMM